MELLAGGDIFECVVRRFHSAAAADGGAPTSNVAQFLGFFGPVSLLLPHSSSLGRSEGPGRGLMYDGRSIDIEVRPEMDGDLVGAKRGAM